MPEAWAMTLFPLNRSIYPIFLGLPSIFKRIWSSSWVFGRFGAVLVEKPCFWCNPRKALFAWFRSCAYDPGTFWDFWVTFWVCSICTFGTFGFPVLGKFGHFWRFFLTFRSILSFSSMDFLLECRFGILNLWTWIFEEISRIRRISGF